jgi:formylmethanofuran--tetrahydromethanopterin N-formyltransferase
VLLFGFDAAGLTTRLVDRIVKPCSVSHDACFDGCPMPPNGSSWAGCFVTSATVYQSSKFLEGHRYWRIPVMEGEFLVQETFGVQKGIVAATC